LLYKGVAEIKECLFILRVAVKILLHKYGRIRILGEELSFTTCILETGKRYPEAIVCIKKMDTILQLIMVNI
jgi:hypothetical protein